MKTLKLPRLLSDHMILQQNKKIRIWGEDEPGTRVTVTMCETASGTVTDENGDWEVFLQEMSAGGPYRMAVRDEKGEERTIEDILIGDVFLCSGQSNMELPMRRVTDHYPYEILQCRNDCIRTFKITEHSDFHGPLKDHLTGVWKSVNEDTLPDFSATAYFFARHLYRRSGVPVGLIDASLGGSRVESWMGRDMLEGYDDLLALADQYRDDDFRNERLARNERQARLWHQALDEQDLGLQEDWAEWKMDVSDWRDIQIPFFFQDTDLAGFIGSVWFRREFDVKKTCAYQEARLYLGTIVDSDTVYINGVEVGHTDYQYPPRKYTIPIGLLREGSNEITIRVKSEIGQGRFTDNKDYRIFWQEDQVELSGSWKYRIGAVCDMVPETDFVNWKPTGLYHGMTAPCHKYMIAGVIWYQGESSARTAGSYRDLMKRLINGYREKWGDEQLPFLYVQLPNFETEVYDSDRDRTYSDWPAVREAQRKILEIPKTGMAVAIDAGEDNDLHPLEKELIGFRLAALAARMLYGQKEECDGPQVWRVDIEPTSPGDGPGRAKWKVTLWCREASGLRVRENGKGREVVDFELIDRDKNVHVPDMKIVGRKVILTAMIEMAGLREIRYCYRSTYRGALIFNKAGYPMAPFCLEVRKRRKPPKSQRLQKERKK